MNFHFSVLMKYLTARRVKYIPLATHGGKTFWAQTEEPFS